MAQITVKSPAGEDAGTIELDVAGILAGCGLDGDLCHLSPAPSCP